MYSIPKAKRLATCDTIVGSADLVGAVLHLSVTDIVPNKDTVLTDFVEATFTGYAASSAIVWGDAVFDSGDRAVSVGSSKSFASSGSAVANTVLSYFVTTALGAYLFGGAFDAAIIFQEDGDGVTLVPTFVFSG